MVAGDAPMWQQVTSGTPLGDVALRRVIFRTDDATYDDVRSAIASHRVGDGGNGLVTLVVERARGEDDGEAEAAGPAQLEPLQQVLARDLSRAPARGNAPPPHPTQFGRSWRWEKQCFPCSHMGCGRHAWLKHFD